MLRSLSVRDLVVIPRLEIEFAPGLTVITGESGAGKSVLLEALALALGERASADRIRPGAERAEARAELSMAAGGEGERFLAEHGLLDEEEPSVCLLRRTVDRGGRSRDYVNDRPVTRQLLAEFGAVEVDMQAQDDNVRLGRRAVQQGLLDDFCLDAGQREAVAGAWRSWREARDALEAFEARSPMGEERRSLLAYQLDELDELSPKSGEHGEIEAEHRRLARIETLQDGAAQALEELGGIESIGTAARALNDLGDSDGDLVTAVESLDSALALLGEAERSLRRYADGLEADPERFALLDERLRRYRDVARKHRVEPEELSRLRERLAEEIASQTGREERRGALRESADEREADYRRLAAEADRRRRRLSEDFARKVGDRMRTLGIDGGFAVAFAEGEWEAGLETAGFLVWTRPDHRPQPIGRVASGGERARISLAIALVAAESSALPCLVLDEADIGVGGVTADTVGRALLGLSRGTQVVCATHAPQVAALGDSHLRVTRDEGGTTAIEDLGKTARVEEVARMLSGAGVTVKARAHARELLQGVAI